MRGGKFAALHNLRWAPGPSLRQGLVVSERQRLARFSGLETLAEHEIEVPNRGLVAKLWGEISDSDGS